MLSSRSRCCLALFLLAASAHASSGDRAIEYQDCVTLCQAQYCSSPSDFVATAQRTLPLSLRLMQWTCLDDCKYTCMHLITDAAMQVNMRIHQYYGKWPFWRFCGMQEPASVLFSLLNLWAHIRGAKTIAYMVPNAHPMRRLLMWWSVINMNAWVWSAVFHTRDKPFTEKLDYFSAALAILFGLYFTVVRLFHLYPMPDRTRLTMPSSPYVAPSAPRIMLYRLWGAVCICAYIAHVSYLSFLPRFDYTYNIAFNLIIGLSQNLLWVLFALPFLPFRRYPALSTSSQYSPPWVGKIMLAVGLTTAATALELFDFPPWWRVVDAHALWHLSTVFVIPLWYAFLVEDALDEGWRAAKI